MPNIPKGTLCISNEQEESGVNFMRVAIFFFFDCRDAIRNNQKKKENCHAHEVNTVFLLFTRYTYGIFTLYVS